MHVSIYYIGTPEKRPEQCCDVLQADKKAVRTFQLLIVAILFFVSPLNSSARISTECTNCHTMHDSQDGASVTGGAAQTALMNLSGSSSCWGCHAVGGACRTDRHTQFAGQLS